MEADAPRGGDADFNGLRPDQPQSINSGTAMGRTADEGEDETDESARAKVDAAIERLLPAVRSNAYFPPNAAAGDPSASTGGATAATVRTSTMGRTGASEQTGQFTSGYFPPNAAAGGPSASTGGATAATVRTSTMGRTGASEQTGQFTSGLLVGALVVVALLLVLAIGYGIGRQAGGLGTRRGIDGRSRHQRLPRDDFDASFGEDFDVTGSDELDGDTDDYADDGMNWGPPSELGARRWPKSCGSAEAAATISNEARNATVRLPCSSGMSGGARRVPPHDEERNWSRARGEEEVHSSCTPRAGSKYAAHRAVAAPGNYFNLSQARGQALPGPIRGRHRC